MNVEVVNGAPLWHTLPASQAIEAAGVAEQQGLSSAEVAVRAERFGPNKFADAKAEPRWRAFLRQYADLMQIERFILQANHCRNRVWVGRHTPFALSGVACSTCGPGHLVESW